MCHRSRTHDSWNYNDQDDIFDEMADIYGQTPPRTRYNRRQRERKQRTSLSENKSAPVREVRCKPSLCRRNTLDAIIFNKMCDKADEEDSERELKLDDDSNSSSSVLADTEGGGGVGGVKENNRKCKRSLKLSRNSERDLKLDIDSAVNYKNNNHLSTFTPVNKEDTSSLISNKMTLLCGVIETKNRFRCLRSKPVEIECKKDAEDLSKFILANDSDELSNKICFSDDNKNVDREIFHENFSHAIRLSANDRERNCCRQISSEESRWQNELKDLIWLELQAFHADRSLVEQDEFLCRQRDAICPLLTEILNYKYDLTSSLIEHGSATSSSDSGFEGSLVPSLPSPFLGSESPEFPKPCTGCLSMHCVACRHSQITALKQVENLLIRLQTAESLYPSSQAFAGHYPQYKSPEFTGRVKAMCLWYNMIRRQRLKLRILRKMLIPDPKPSPDYVDSGHDPKFEIFDFDPSSPSTKSTTTFIYLDEGHLEQLDFDTTEIERGSYRRYIEEVLKTRGLSKSLNFLERLHMSVLRKANLALMKEQSTAYEEYEDQELRRYGFWSSESQALNLPSYANVFLFLSRVPLDIVHEFLQMRLQQKPVAPGALSVRQLMREMREGLKIACVYRDRFLAHSRTVTGCESELDITAFDDSLQQVFVVYLEYLKQWVEMMPYGNYHKGLIDDEWTFVKSIARNIKNGYTIGGVKFCEINGVMIHEAIEFLGTRPQEIVDSMTDIEESEDVRYQFMALGREWQAMFIEAREKITKSLLLTRSLKRDVDQWFPNDELETALDALKHVINDLRARIYHVITQFQVRVDQADEAKIENDLTFKTRIREILHQAYRMGFDYHREVLRTFQPNEELIHGLVNFANLWIDFVITRCERGRGLRPRWAHHGLEFLIMTCEPANTEFLSEQKFGELKIRMQECWIHIIGEIESTHPDELKVLPLSRTTSPRISVKDLKVCNPENVSLIVSKKISAKQTRVTGALRRLEEEIDERRRANELIGRVASKKSADSVRIKVRRVTFTWQRGIKIGQGRFGKVYTVVNNQTGELLAMKEVPLQPGDHRAIRRVAEELQIFEGIKHDHLVRYYGVEIQHEEMLIFMEFCAEGTLESLIAASAVGLPEIFVRKYVHQLLSAISVLHFHGIVHRDIKTANIFLTDQGNCLKLGDFGSAVEIKAHSTMPGELQGFVGTQAYMAPEVFMKTEHGHGHGRAADIWSFGCCVIEMASGKRPWAEFDSNYQIMFKVGMGETPAMPKTFCNEGVDLIENCLQHDPKKRPHANDLLAHPFARNYDDVNVELLGRIVT
ncbi:mitogen-activated protein kinase kinase kinase 4 [Microplitis mediator]|uniref:mitogen-activated protein kinase kinase kinase 4 n=1 Tax=Microplitis mediator TaxID=375433 RepID=UPI0025551CE9|nr:mitogen-activated protein kinase kinase kinase 4 [Microplitis mediator]XP_057325369.1 mitogen-activated protein kinase kinase kinase 4 [Microplitis mediator]XP_057325378.1 mitogen-activated protein kinase kinase kinase 4 [Microplitis mediator]